VLIQPLIEFILPLYKWEPSCYNLRRADSIIRSSFKLFSGLKPNTDNQTVDLLSGYDFKSRATLMHHISQEKWAYRKKGDRFQYEFLPQEVKEKLTTNKLNVCKRMPKELIYYLNTTKSICPICKVPNSFCHLETQHNCTLPNLGQVLKMISPIQRAKMPRRECLNMIKELIMPLLLKMRKSIDGLRMN